MPEAWQSKALDAALEAARASATELLKLFRPEESPLKTWTKDANELITEADLASDRAIVACLEDSGVTGNILSEQSLQAGAEDGLKWLVDPLCGTVPFSTGLDHWGVNIALWRNDIVPHLVVGRPAVHAQLIDLKGQKS